jgi:hypothetical protein
MKMIHLYSESSCNTYDESALVVELLAGRNGRACGMLADIRLFGMIAFLSYFPSLFLVDCCAR